MSKARVTLGGLMAACTLVSLTSGCNPHPLKDVRYESVTVKPTTLPLDPNRDVDILFVIDNSGSMGEEQATLADNFEAFIDVLEAPDVNANYRIAVTTTDNGNPWCTGTGPEAGNFVMSSCRDRLDQFVFRPGAADEVDRRAEACEDLCPAELADLQPLPTALSAGGERLVRPWLERTEGAANLPEGVDTVQAFQCFGPQGIDGCGFESPLESMYKALLRSTVDGEDEYGFMRDDALLAVVFVTDEADCSARSEAQEIFLPDGNRVFWSDPEATSPSSAVCWNAGVSCSGGPGTFETCIPEDRGIDGGTVDEDDAVLQPLSRYFELLENIETHKHVFDPSMDVLVSVISGVPQGHPGTEIQYTQGVNAQFEADFGIAPGCSSENGTAVPPVRLRAFADNFAAPDEPNMFSICDADYRPALEVIANRIRSELRPACFEACVADIDPTAEGLQPQCVVEETVVGGRRRDVPRCIDDGMGRWTLPEGADVCAYEVTGTRLHEDCQEGGYNIEFRLLQRPGTLRPAGSQFQATCELSQEPEIECPGS